MMLHLHVCFLWRKGEWRVGFSLLLTAEPFYLPGPVGLLFLSQRACYFSKAFVYSNPSCGSAHPAHFAKVNVKKTKWCWVLVCFMMLLSSLQIFHNRDLILLLKSGCVGHFGCLFDFGGLESEKRMPWIFLTSFTCEYYYCFEISVISQKSLPGYNSDETWKYISPEILPLLY